MIVSTCPRGIFSTASQVMSRSLEELVLPESETSSHYRSENSGIDDVVLDGIRRCSGSGVDAQLVKDVADVAMHRSLAQVQLASDRVVRPAGGYQPQHLDLAFAQAAGTNRSCWMQQPFHPMQIGAGTQAGKRRLR